MLLSSTYSSRPLLSTSLRITKSVVESEDLSPPPDYYSAEEEQIDKTRCQIEAALNDLKRFLDVGQPVPAPLDHSVVHLSLGMSVNPEETRSVFELLERQSQRLEDMEERLRGSESGDSSAVVVSQCFPENTKVIDFLRAFQDCNPAMLVNFQDIIDFLSSRECAESLGVEFSAEDLRTAYFARWTADFETRVVAVLKIKFGDYRSAAKENSRTEILARTFFSSDDGKMSIYQLWLCAIAMWWVCGGQYVEGRGLCLGGAIGYAM